MKMSAVWQASIVMGIGQKYGWLDLIPWEMLFEFLRYLIDNCARSREGFCERMKNPSYRLERRTMRQIRAFLWRKGVNVPQGLTFASYEILDACFDTAQMMTDEQVMECYDNREAA